MKNEIEALFLATMVLISMLFGCLPLVSAAYTVDEHYMPPESDDLQPICAMKTDASGFFYKPNLLVDVLKIELLDIQNYLVGDQKGNESQYGIGNWPDAFVDVKDVLFINLKYGSYPGRADWDYMADVVPDMFVDVKDILAVTLNYGHLGDYSRDLSGVQVIFDTGNITAPDENGFVTIPQDAINFTVKRNDTAIGAMVTFWGPRNAPIAYSTTFEFTVPSANQSDLGKEVWYNVLAKVYVPPELARQNFYFVATASERVQNVKLNAYAKAGSGSSVNIDLGILSSGYHLLDFQFVDISGSGSLSFYVTNAAGTPAWLTRFRIYVPNYSDINYEYTVTTTTWCSMKDDYFLIGYTDDFIDDVCVDGLVWQDWMWDMGAYGAIYAWGDGFSYPLGNLENNTGLNAYTLSFKFGEIWGAGLLDFQYVSWTQQRDRIGPPKFYAFLDFKPNNMERFGDFNSHEIISIPSAIFYGGSQWIDPEHPEVSERNFETTLRINATRFYSCDLHNPPIHNCFDTCFEIGLALESAEWILSAGAMDDLAVLMNLTCLHFTTNTPSTNDPSLDQWCLTLRNVIQEIYSYQWIEIPGIEYYGTGDSVVKADWTVAADYTATVIRFASVALATAGVISPVTALVGSTVGFSINTITAVYRYMSGQNLGVYQETITQLHHRQLEYNNHYDTWGRLGYGPIKILAPDQNPTSSNNDIVFFKIDPISGKRCGLTKIVLKGEAAVVRVDKTKGLFPIEDCYIDVPLGELEIALYIPWFALG